MQLTAYSFTRVDNEHANIVVKYENIFMLYPVFDLEMWCVHFYFTDTDKLDMKQLKHCKLLLTDSDQ